MALRPLAVLILAGAAFAASAQQIPSARTFGLGARVDTYPAVEWIQGEPVTAFDKDKIYIVEVWATWCGPCKQAIPHINELHRKFGDKVTFIGQSIWETDYDTVKSFVARKGAGMSYPIAFGGGRDSEFSVKWMRAAGLGGIPATFVIQDNTVVWMPNPSRLTDETLQLLIDRKFNREALTQARAPDPYQRAIDLIYRDKNYEAGIREVEAVLEKHPNDRAIQYKATALQRSGQAQKAIDYLREENGRSGYSDGALRYSYLTMLTQEKRWEELQEASKTALAAAARITPGAPPDDLVKFMAMALHERQDNPGLAAFINDVTARTADTGVLFMVEGSSRAVPQSTDRAVADARLGAVRRILDSTPADFHVINYLVENRWAIGEKNAARGMIREMLKEAKANPRRQTLAGCLQELLSVLEEDQLPSQQQREEWQARLAK